MFSGYEKKVIKDEARKEAAKPKVLGSNPTLPLTG